ncbi:hypothetical protein KKF60_02315 [Patescibacteria group bacterium]|nr:hypothetical protein [Patescibacteria group bacterium]MBU4458702.1 hypothetical protein [Patescibacteria group bacterium]MCG2696297.1 hypothetical protein [Candidatus Portnoybacteria bacterium]
MINSIEEKLIIAYLQGGNAKDKSPAILKECLEVIKEAITESKSGQSKAEIFAPRRDSGV